MYEAEMQTLKKIPCKSVPQGYGAMKNQYISKINLRIFYTYTQILSAMYIRGIWSENMVEKQTNKQKNWPGSLSA